MPDKIPLNVVIEDDLSLEIISHVLEKTDNPFFIDKIWPDSSRNKASRGSGYIIKKVRGFNQAAQYSCFLILTDLDTRECAPGFIIELIPGKKNRNLIMCVAVREVEAWLLADRAGFADLIGVSIDIVPTEPELVRDPKQEILNLVRKSRKRSIRQEVLPRDATAKIGPGYNTFFSTFVRDQWNLAEARRKSGSLNRCIERIAGFSPPPLA